MLRPGRSALLISATLLAVAPSLSAQFQNPITAAKDAYNKAKAQQKQQQQQQPAGQTSTTQRAAATGASSAAGAAPDSSCCTADAMKKLAAQSSAPDVVGIRLGMTPQEGIAAIKAHNPALKLYQVNLRLQHPGSSGFDRVPHEIVACNNCSGRSVPVGAEVIVLELTPPPNPPLVAVVSRYTNFEPTLAGNLVNGLEKKYGTEFPGPSERRWLYDASGKQVTTSSETAKWCANGENMRLVPSDSGWFAYAHGGAYPSPENDDGNVDVSSYRAFQGNLQTVQATMHLGENPCMPYTLVTSDLSVDIGPNSQLTSVFVRMSSGGLVYAAQRSTHDWLQAEADAKAKAAHDAAAQRTGTTF